MTIRRATLEDVEVAAEYSEQFNAESSWELGTISDWRAYITDILADENQAIFLSKRGIISGGVFAWPWRPGALISHESIWWAKDGQGFALLETFTDWAKSKGATKLQIGNLITNETDPAKQFSRTCKVFGRLGYQPVEIGLRRNL